MQDIDRIDRALIRALRRDGRISNVALAAEVGLSPSACLRRVRALERAGVIRGYTALVAQPLTDTGHLMIVRVRLMRQTEDMLRAFEAEILKHPEIRQCYLMSGEEDYLLHVLADGPGDYERIHKEILSRLPGVSRINSGFAIRKVL